MSGLDLTKTKLSKQLEVLYDDAYTICVTV